MPVMYNQYYGGGYGYGLLDYYDGSEEKNGEATAAVLDSKSIIDSTYKPSDENITLERLYETVKMLVETRFPIGYVYLSMDATSPAILFGGKWRSIEGCLLMGTEQSPAMPTDYQQLGEKIQGAKKSRFFPGVCQFVKTTTTDLQDDEGKRGWGGQYDNYTSTGINVITVYMWEKIAN